MEHNCAKCFAAVVCVSGLWLYSEKGTELRSPVNSLEEMNSLEEKSFILITNNCSELLYRAVIYLMKKTTTKTDTCPGSLS